MRNVELRVCWLQSYRVEINKHSFFKDQSEEQSLSKPQNDLKYGNFKSDFQ